MCNSNSLLVGWPQVAPCFDGLRQWPRITAPLPEVTLISTAANAAGKSFILCSKKQAFALPTKPGNSRREWRHLKIVNVAHKTGGGQASRWSLTWMWARHTLEFQFAGMGSGEGRANRPRSRHCNRLKSRKPGHPLMPQRPALFARRSAAAKPLGVSWGFFVMPLNFRCRGIS